MKKILPFFSYLFHPVFIGGYATSLYFFSTHTQFSMLEKGLCLLQVCLLTLFIPILFFLALRAKGKIQSAMAPPVSERKIPLLIQCFLIIFLLKNNIPISSYLELHFFFLAALLSTILALVLVFLKIKASLHIMGMGALTFFDLGLNLHFHNQNMLLFLFLVATTALVGASRLIMQAHTPKELIIGFLIGSGTQLMLLPIWL